MVPGHERDLVQLGRGWQHRALRRRPRSPEEARDDAAGRLRSPRHLGGLSDAPRARLRKLGDPRGLSGRGWPSESLPPRPLRGRGSGSGRRHRSLQRDGSERPVRLSAADRRLAAPKRLADGYAWALSPDGKFALASPRPGPEILLVPTGPGQPSLIDTPGLRRGGRWGSFPTVEGSGSWRRIPRTRGAPGCRIWRREAPRGHASGGWRDDCCRATDASSARARPMATGHSIRRRRRKPTRSSASFPARSRFSGPRTGGSSMSAARTSCVPATRPIITRVYRLDPRTGRRELWKEIRPVNPSGGGAIGTIFFSADGKTCVYTHHRYSSELFLVEGLK